MQRLAIAIEKQLGTLAFLAAFAVHLFFSGPGEHWLDASELVAAGQSLGIAHAPGEPTYALAAKLATFIPVGGVAFRIVLLSALAQAGVIALLAIALRFGTRRLRFGVGLRIATALGGAALAILLPASLLQVMRPEVYALNALMIAAFFAAIARQIVFTQLGGGVPQVSWLATAALVWGLGLGVHPLVTALALPPAILALFFFARRSIDLRSAALAAGFALLGFAVYIYLPARATGRLPLPGGDPSNLSRFIDVLLARSFQKSFEGGGSGGGVISYLLDALHPLVLACSLVGLGLLARKSWRAAAVLGALIVLNLASVAAQRAVDPANPDVAGYLLPALLTLTALAALAPGLVAHGLPAAASRAKAPAAVITAVAVLFGALLAHLGAREDGIARPSRSYGAREAPLALLDAQPTGAVVIASHNQTLFSWWALQLVENARPDVTVVFRGFLLSPWYRPLVARTLPEVAAAARADFGFDAAVLEPLAKLRPVMIEPFAFRDFRDDSLDQSLHLEAGLARVGPRPSVPPPAVPALYDTFAWRQLAHGDLHDRGWALFHHYVGVLMATALGDTGLARFHAQRALEIAPDDPDLRALLAGLP